MNLLSYKPVEFVLSNNQMLNMPQRTSKINNYSFKKEDDVNGNHIPEFSASQVDDLVTELKENLRLSAMPSKTRSCLSRKSSRASPYRIPVKCGENCDKTTCPDYEMKNRRNAGRLGHEEDPYELLQKLIQDGNLVSEAVRRLNLSRELPPKKKIFYESDEEVNSSPSRRHNVSQECSE